LGRGALASSRRNNTVEVIFFGEGPAGHLGLIGAVVVRYLCIDPTAGGLGGGRPPL